MSKSIAITVNEMPHIGHLFGDRAVPTSLPYDMLLTTERGLVPIERKRIPEDLIQSVYDGRLGREIAAMREVSKFYFVILHGDFVFDSDGKLVCGRGHGSQWTRASIRNLLRSIQVVEGCYIEYARTDGELVEVVDELQRYMDDPRHVSMHRREPIETQYFVPTRAERIIHFYAGIPGISVARGRALQSVFPVPADLFSSAVRGIDINALFDRSKDIDSIPGFGRVMADRIRRFILNGDVR